LVSKKNSAVDETGLILIKSNAAQLKNAGKVLLSHLPFQNNIQKQYSDYKLGRNIKTL